MKNNAKMPKLSLKVFFLDFTLKCRCPVPAKLIANWNLTYIVKCQLATVMCRRGSQSMLSQPRLVTSHLCGHRWRAQFNYLAIDHVPTTTGPPAGRSKQSNIESFNSLIQFARVASIAVCVDHSEWPGWPIMTGPTCLPHDVTVLTGHAHWAHSGHRHWTYMYTGHKVEWTVTS